MFLFPATESRETIESTPRDTVDVVGTIGLKQIARVQDIRRRKWKMEIMTRWIDQVSFIILTESGDH